MFCHRLKTIRFCRFLQLSVPQHASHETIDRIAQYVVEISQVQCFFLITMKGRLFAKAYEKHGIRDEGQGLQGHLQISLASLRCDHHTVRCGRTMATAPLLYSRSSQNRQKTCPPSANS